MTAATSGTTTKTVPNVGLWPNSEGVVRLREWAADRTHALNADVLRDLIIGTQADCDIRLVDPKNRISRKHADLHRDGTRWLIRNRSKNGLRIDGESCTTQELTPGMEIEIGPVTLIAESRRLIALRAYLARLLGWSPAHVEAVDSAARSVRLAGTRLHVLVLCGSDDDLLAIAAGVHSRALGPDRPFVVCDPRRRAVDAEAAGQYVDGMAALAAALDGTVCVRSSRLPRDFPQMMAALRTPGARVQLIVCAQQPKESKPFLVPPIIVPPLAKRADEIDHIIFECASEAMLALSATESLTRADRAWVRTHASSSLPEIEKGTLRLMALRKHGGHLPRAAAELGITRAALAKWLGTRPLPMSTMGADGP